ncbi:MAG: efflux transporter outer membrane subunit [Massilia sp.]
MTTSPPLSRRLTVGALAAAFALSACVSIPPDRQQVKAQALPAALADPALPLSAGAWPSPSWWTSYGDTRLTALIEQGLRAAPSLAAARARIGAANAAAALQEAQRGGQLGLEAGVNRQRYSGNGLFPEPIGGTFHNDVSVGLKASYDFDWWGRHRAQVAAALGEVNARRADEAQARQVIAAAIARSYAELQFLQARQANAAQQMQVAQALVKERQLRIAHGLARIDEQRGAELDVARLEQLAARLDAASRRERETLRALAGGDPKLVLEPSALTASAPPHVLPDALGVQLLAHRADLQAARFRVEATLGRVNAAQAAFYPDLNLSAGLGLDALSLGSLLRANSLTVLVGSALQLPIFDNGRLGAALGTVRAQRDEVVADYNQAVINAVRDVAQQADSLHGIDAELARQAGARAAAEALRKAARQRIDNGLGERATLLQAEATVLSQADIALQLRQAQRQAEIALNQTLGGGFDAAAFSPTSTLAQRRHD